MAYDDMPWIHREHEVIQDRPAALTPAADTWYYDGMSMAYQGVRLRPRRRPVAAKAVAETAYEGLLDLLLTRELAPGVLLAERRLAEALGASRTPLREALRRLEGEGLIVRQANRVMVKETTISDYLQALEIRRLLEVEAAGQAAGKITSDETAELRVRIERLMTMSRPSPADHWAVDDAVHGEIAAASGNDLLAEIIRRLRRRTRIFNLRRMPDRFLPGCREHLLILDALDAADREAARAAMAAHLDNVKASIIRKLIGT